MKKLILTTIFFVIGILKPRKRVSKEVEEKKLHNYRKIMKDQRPKKIKKYKNSH
jgi:hypothetical protein